MSWLTSTSAHVSMFQPERTKEGQIPVMFHSKATNIQCILEL